MYTYLKIESEVLMGDSRPRFFLDGVDVGANGVESHSNLRNDYDKHHIRAEARKMADKWGIYVVDEPLIKETVKAQVDTQRAILKAAETDEIDHHAEWVPFLAGDHSAQ